MKHSRRDFFLQAAAATATLSAAPLAEAASGEGSSSINSDHITRLFEALPGDVAFKILVPAACGGDEFKLRYNAGSKLFVASAFKGFVLCEALRQIDSPEVVHTLETTQIKLDESIWSLGSPSFDPPHLSGWVRERATLEAMITSSDNTATDMIMKLAGVANVRSLIASMGLKHTLIPESTRAFAAYLFGATNYKTITWDELNSLINEGRGVVNPFLNDVETLASSADDLVTLYSRALAGQFFKHPETLNEFRRLLTLCDYIYLVPLPTGVSAYAKSGNADSEGFHVRTIAGGILAANRWIYFAFIINWYAESAEDPETLQKFYAAINKSLNLVIASVSSAK